MELDDGREASRSGHSLGLVHFSALAVPLLLEEKGKQGDV